MFSLRFLTRLAVPRGPRLDPAIGHVSLIKALATMRALCASIAVFVLGCASGDEGPAEEHVAHAELSLDSPAPRHPLHVEPETALIPVSASLQFVATIAGSKWTLPPNGATWTTSDPSIALVDSAGLVTAVAAGTTVVEASFHGMSALATLTVDTAALTAVRVSPADGDARIGATTIFTAYGLFSDGTIHPLGSSVTWSTGDPFVASVDNAGGATGLAEGITAVLATTGTTGLFGRALLTVGPVRLRSLAVTPFSASISVGSAAPFRATGTFTNGRKQDVTNIANWTSSDPAVATVSSEGLATSVAIGATRIRATLGNHRATASLEVVSCPAGQTDCGGRCVDEQVDNGNCGGCGLACSSACSGGRCLMALASGQGAPYSIAIDAHDVYWSNSENPGNIMKVAIGGGTPTTLVSGGYPFFIAVDATNLYWFNLTTGSVMQMPLGGGAPTILASNQNGQYITIDRSNVYWVNSDFFGTVMKVAIGGGTPVTLASGQNSPAIVVVNATNAYWSDSNHSGSIMSVPLGGGTPATLASGQDLPAYLAIDAANLYWTNLTGNVMQVSLDGGVPIILASGGFNPHGIAVDATSVYWTDTGLGTVMKVPIGGGTATTLATNQGYPFTIAVDATSAYWTDNSTGTVMKLTPK